MIEFKYDKNEFTMTTEANMSEIVRCFVALLDVIEKDHELNLGFKMAERYRRYTDATNNSDN